MNERAASQYGRRYQKLIRHLTAKDRAELSREDYEELEADCTMAALRAVADYCPDHESGAKMDSLIGRYVMTTRSEYRRRHARHHNDISLDSPANPGDPNGRTLVENLADDRAIDLDADMERAPRLALIKEIAEELPPGQRRAILGALAGRTIPEIARDAGLSRGCVYQCYHNGAEAVCREIARREHRQAAEKAYLEVMQQ